MDFIEKAAKFSKFGRVVEAKTLLREVISENNPVGATWRDAKIALIELEYKCKQWEKVLAQITELESYHPLTENIIKYREDAMAKLVQPIVSGELFISTIDWLKNFDFSRSMGNELINAELIQLEKTKSHAHNQNISLPYLSWNDLRSEVWKSMNAIIFDHRVNMESFDSDFGKVKNEIEIKLSILEGKLAFYFYDDIIADFELIAKSAFVRFSNQLANELKRVYAAGYFPCGWRGNYPSGVICYSTSLLSEFPNQDLNQ